MPAGTHSALSDPFLPANWVLRRRIAQYIVGLFHFHRLRANPDPEGTHAQLCCPTPPPISFQLMRECDSVARVLACAFQNQCKLNIRSLQRVSDEHAVSVSWDAVEYAQALPRSSTLKKEVEDALLQEFPPLIPAAEVTARTVCLPMVREPAVITDVGGRILAWSLPAIIPPDRQVRSPGVYYLNYNQ